MKPMRALLFTLPLCSARLLSESSLGRTTAAVSPVQQVLTLLTDLEAKIKAAGQKEEVAYSQFQEWCRGGSKDKEWEIKTAKANIETLSATITKAQTDLASGSANIKDLAAAISGSEADLKAATELRTKERSEFQAAESELLDVVDTLDRAINVLERKLRGSAFMQEKIDNKDVGKLLQMLGTVVDAASLSLHDKKRLMSLAQSRASLDDSDGEDSEEDAAEEQAEEEEELGAPAAEAYKSHSQNILDVLEDMRIKAQSQLNELRHEEVNAKHSYELTKQSVEDQIQADKNDMADSKAAAASAAEAKANAEGDLQVTQKDLADAEKAYELMKSSCSTAATDHEASLKSRQEELEALSEAKKAIMDSATGAASATYGDSFLQLINSEQQDSASVTGEETKVKSMLSTHADLRNYEVVNMIRRLAKQEHSSALAQLAGRVAAAIKFGSSSGADPFAKVKNLIIDMIDRLQKEAGMEASHKAYCDKEMAGTKQKVDDLTSNLDQLRAKIDKKKALSVDLKNEVQELQGEVLELMKSQSELDEVRGAEHKAFVETKVDLETGLNGVRQALQILREYYAQDTIGGAGGASASLVQQEQTEEQPEVPEYHSKSAGAGTGVIRMLEVVESDFGKALAQSEMEEDTAAVEYQKISMQNRVTKATKDQDVKYKTRESAELDKAVAELSSDGESTQTELDAVLEYSKSIRGQCIAQPMTYEERKARRQAEVDGLKEALEILEGQGMLLQQGQSGSRHAQGLRGSVRRHHHHHFA